MGLLCIVDTYPFELDPQSLQEELDHSALLVKHECAVCGEMEAIRIEVNHCS